MSQAPKKGSFELKGVLATGSILATTLLLSGSVGCGLEQDNGGEGGSGGNAPMYVRVEMEDAVIGPGKSDGSSWDGFSDVPKEAWDQLGAALAEANPYAAVVALVAGPLFQSLDKPEAFGTARLDANGYTGSGITHLLATIDNNQEDTFTPIWPERVIWTKVPLAGDPRIRVELLDEDISNHDPIGVAVINADDLAAALEAHKLFHVNVSGQTSKQLLFLGISVRAE